MAQIEAEKREFEERFAAQQREVKEREEREAKLKTTP